MEVGRSGIAVWNDQGVAVDFPLLDTGAEVIGPWGWLLRREARGYVVDADVAVKRDANGTIVAMRLEECEANGSKLQGTKDGPQMSDGWIKSVQDRMKKKRRTRSRELAPRI